MSTSKSPLKTSELANEANEGVFKSNRKSQDEGYSSLNSSTFHNGAQAVGRAESSKARKSTWNDLYIDRRRQKISTVTLLLTDSTPLGRPKSTQVDLLDPTRRSRYTGDWRMDVEGGDDAGWHDV